MATAGERTITITFDTAVVSVPSGQLGFSDSSANPGNYLVNLGDLPPAPGTTIATSADGTVAIITLPATSPVLAVGDTFSIKGNTILAADPADTRRVPLTRFTVPDTDYGNHLGCGERANLHGYL